MRTKKCTRIWWIARTDPNIDLPFWEGASERCIFPVYYCWKLFSVVLLIVLVLSSWLNLARKFETDFIASCASKCASKCITLSVSLSRSLSRKFLSYFPLVGLCANHMWVSFWFQTQVIVGSVLDKRCLARFVKKKLPIHELYYVDRLYQLLCFLCIIFSVVKRLWLNVVKIDLTLNNKM